MKITNALNPVWYSELHDVINITVEFEGVGSVPFLAHKGDCEKHGRELFQRAEAGEFGVIMPFIPTKEEFTNSFDALVMDKKIQIAQARSNSIATIRGTSSSNLQDYESKLSRLTQVALMIKLDPEEWFGCSFNGQCIPSNKFDAVSTANTFLASMKAAHDAIEDTIQKYDNLLLLLANATSIADIEEIAC